MWGRTTVRSLAILPRPSELEKIHAALQNDRDVHSNDPISQGTTSRSRVGEPAKQQLCSDSVKENP